MLIFRERLRALREQNNFEQKDMGKKLNITASAYGFYEQGRNEPSLQTLVEIAKIFDVSTDYLLGLSNTEKIPVNYSLAKNIVLSKDELEIIRRMKDNSFLAEISSDPEKNVERLIRYWEFIKNEFEMD